MSKSNKILVAVATLLVGNAGCSQLRAPRSAPMDEAVRKVELTPPAVSEFKKAKANEPVKLADAAKAGKVTEPPSPVSLASSKGKVPVLPSDTSGLANRNDDGKMNGDGEFVIGKKITKSTSAKAGEAATTSESLASASKTASKTGPNADSKFVPPAPPSLEANVASSLPGPAVPPQKGLAALPGALPPAATNLPTAPATPTDDSVQLANADAGSSETEGKKIPHAVSRGVGATPPESGLDGFALNEVEPSSDEGTTLAKAETAIAKADAPKNQPATIDYKPMPTKVDAAAVSTTERATEHNDPQVKPVAAVEDVNQVAAAMPAIAGSLPPAQVVAATPPAAPASVPAQPPQIIAAMPPAPLGAPPAVAANPATLPVTAPATAVPSPTPVSPGTDGKLELDRFQLCTEIVGFGKTVPRDTEMVSRGERLLAYVEVRNFASRSMNGEFETALGCDLSLDNAAGQTIYNQTFADIVDKCAKPRRDFFCHFLFSMPSTVLPGKYKLRIRIVDRNSSATSEAVVDVMVGSKESSISGRDPKSPTLGGAAMVNTEEPARLEFSKGHKAKGMDQS